MTELVLKEEVFEIVGAAMEVYYRLGRGFLEPVYQEALQIELSRRAIRLKRRKNFRFVTKATHLRRNTFQISFASDK